MLYRTEEGGDRVLSGAPYLKPLKQRTVENSLPFGLNPQPPELSATTSEQTKV